MTRVGNDIRHEGPFAEYPGRLSGAERSRLDEPRAFGREEYGSPQDRYFRGWGCGEESLRPMLHDLQGVWARGIPISGESGLQHDHGIFEGRRLRRRARLSACNRCS